MKPLRFLGSSLRDLQGFPADARREAGYQLEHVARIPEENAGDCLA
jgi:phage-related protein